MPPTWTRRIASALALCLLAVACNGSEPDAQGTTTSSPSPATAEVTTTAAPRTTSRLLTDVDAVWQIDGDRGYTPEQVEIVRSYVKAEQANLVAHLDPVDPNDPGLVATTTGRHLSQLQKVFGEDKAAGVAKSEPSLLAIVTGRITAKSPSRVELESCYVSDAHHYEVASGRRLEKEGSYAFRLVTAMELVDGTWKLEQQGEVASWPGVRECADPIS